MKFIPLTQGKVALVDDRDYERLNKHKWYAIKHSYNFYAVRIIRLSNGKYRRIWMHREILGLKSGDKRQSDHKNHDGLDNRRENLRRCTASQNSQNMSPQKSCSSVFKGVSWRKDSRKWRAQIIVKGQNIYLGPFNSEIKAAKAYDRAARKYFGRFACLNLKP